MVDGQHTEPTSVSETVNAAETVPIEIVDARPPEFSDDALAQKFAERHGENFHYIADWGHWFEWDDVRWAREPTYRAFDRARAICRVAASEAKASGKTSTAVKLASAKTVAAVERMAKTDRRIAATVDQWDTDLDVFNGEMTIDLSTGEHYVPRREDYCTKLSPVAAEGDCPLWRTFLARVTDGDEELQAYLARVCGYWLTGHTHEHALFFLYGTGANGKSVFVETIQGIMGDYATTTPVENFMATHGDRHPTELAALRGARLVVAPETEAGRHWNESRIKQITGGDTIAARFVRQDFFTFKPTFKICIVGNHKPSLRTIDEAIRRRIHLIPYNITIPASERDPKLAEKLKAEWPGILAWAVQGCLDWRKDGLNPPQAVIEATDDYLSGEDSFAAWLEECTEPASDWHFESSADLFASWKAWAERAGEGPGTRKRFAGTLQDRGYAPKRTENARGFEGIRLKRPDYSEDGRYGG